MPQKTIQGSEKLGKQIRSRRVELGLTIEEAASRAGVGTKTWCRYESGASIRQDKYRGICRTLNWHSFPDQGEENDPLFSVAECRTHEAWSEFLENRFGPAAALSFAAGSDILYDHIAEEMEALSSMPAGTHIGQLGFSWLKDILPEQFLPYYDYEFLYRMKCALCRLTACAKNHLPMTAHSVLEELLIFFCSEEASALIEISGGISGIEDKDGEAYTDWVFDLFGDEDILTFLYSDIYLSSDHSYHFSHWDEQNFFMDETLCP